MKTFVNMETAQIQILLQHKTNYKVPGNIRTDYVLCTSWISCYSGFLKKDIWILMDYFFAQNIFLVKY